MEQDTPAASPPIRFQVIQRRTIDLEDRSLILNRVAPPVLPSKPTAPAVQNAAPAEEPPDKKAVILFLSATVYDRKVTEISFVGGQGKAAIFSNVDFNLFEGLGQVETDDTSYSLMLAVSNQTAEDAAARNRQLAEQGALMARQRIPPPGEFSPARSECIVVEDTAHPAPTGEELAALEALHVFFDANKPQLARKYAERAAAEAERLREAKAHPAVPPDVIVNYWRKPNEIPKAREAR